MTASAMTAPRPSSPFTPTAGDTQQSTDNGGLILIQAYNGSVVATGNAVQADALTSGSSGGEIRIEAKNNVTLDTAAIFARGDFDPTGGFGSGGKIGPLAPTVPPPGQAPIRAFLGALSWQNGVGDARPTGAGVTVAAQRGQINLQACTGVNTTGSTFPTVGAIVGTYPNVLAAACVGGPIVPAYVTGFPSAACESLCTLPGGGKKSGIKFNDLAGDGVKDPTDPPLADWEIGSERTRRPVSLKYALANAGAKVGTPSSPTPPMGILRSATAGFGMMVTPTCGISCARIIRLFLKFRICATPLTKVCRPYRAAFRPCTMPPTS